MLTYFLKNVVFYFTVFVSVIFLASEIDGGLNLALLLPLSIFTLMVRSLFAAFIFTVVCDKVIDKIMGGK